ncbi:BTB/POZ domain-containing protein 1-like isoform X2 [Syngnathus typhle]|uniref:BTB/POZ domain-containing protein 1-like isoform X2 n=1 Tax=Syngnathus typhle TaxID=161592 RepID=UPI002A69DAC9|nr:BTB/POZ domain-containing protein 1-like isoform X2 [Syngnathus typhle]
MLWTTTFYCRCRYYKFCDDKMQLCKWSISVNVCLHVPSDWLAPRLPHSAGIHSPATLIKISNWLNNERCNVWQAFTGSFRSNLFYNLKVSEAACCSRVLMRESSEWPFKFSLWSNCDRFLYSDDAHITPETVMSTLNAAKKYAVPALATHCVEFVSKHLKAHNAFMFLTQARLFDVPQIASLCLDTIDKSTAEAVNTEGFTDIDLETLCTVLERDTLNIRENRLFEAVAHWAEAECTRQRLPATSENKQKVLGKALQLIRFPLMSVETFPTANPTPRPSNNDRSCCYVRGEECTINRFQHVESRWGYSGTSDRIRFNVSRRISIVGFGLYGSIHGHTDYQVNIQIMESDKHLTVGQNDTGFSCDGTSNTFRVMFTEPVEILPNVSYTACATLKGPDSHCGTKGLKKVTQESATGTKTTFVFFKSPGNNNGTSVEDGQIPEIIYYT